MENFQFKSVKNSIEAYLKKEGVEYEVGGDGSIYIPEITIDGLPYEMGIIPDDDLSCINFYQNLGIKIRKVHETEVMKYLNLVNNGKELGFLYIEDPSNKVLQKIQLIVTEGAMNEDYWPDFFRHMADEFSAYSLGLFLISERGMDGVEAFAELAKTVHDSSDEEFE
jgi:hypothetical protein